MKFRLFFKLFLMFFCKSALSRSLLDTQVSMKLFFDVPHLCDVIYAHTLLCCSAMFLFPADTDWNDHFWKLGQIWVHSSFLLALLCVHSWEIIWPFIFARYLLTLSACCLMLPFKRCSIRNRCLMGMPGQDVVLHLLFYFIIYRK